MVALNRSTQRIQRLVQLKFTHQELLARESLLARVKKRRELEAMSDVSRIQNDELLRRLHDHGFRAETLVALQLLPVAMIAWASGSITPQERRQAEAAIFRSEVSGNVEAIALFRSWLDTKPSDTLWLLWMEYVHEASRVDPPEVTLWRGEFTWEVSHRIAWASGGFLGVGMVCRAEQEILDRILDAYDLI